MEQNNRILLYHTGFEEVRNPDIRHGRSNADFGQGFYMSADKDFSERWAKERKETSVYVNSYSLELDGLKIKRFERNREWFDYIFRNRSGYKDSLKDYDVIIGPIANDTIYDTWGIITSGLLSPEQALELLSIGPAYEQTVIKTEMAAGQLRWLASRIIDPSEIGRFREIVRKEETEYQTLFARRLDTMTGRK